MQTLSQKRILTSWLACLLALAVFIGACVMEPETNASRAAHRREAEGWQAKQEAKGVGRPPHRTRARWKDAPWAEHLEGWDHATFVRINSGWDNRVFDAAMPVFSTLGNGATMAALLLALLWWSALKKRADWKTTALLGTVGVVLGLLAPLFKLVQLVQRYRPPTLFPHHIVLLTRTHGLWGLPVLRLTPLYGGSFPSGHTLIAFTVATIFARRHPWTAPWAYAVAGLIGLSRIAVGVHFPLDVLAGALLGLLVGTLLTTYLPRRREVAK